MNSVAFGSALSVMLLVAPLLFFISYARTADGATTPVALAFSSIDLLVSAGAVIGSWLVVSGDGESSALSGLFLLVLYLALALVSFYA